MSRLGAGGGPVLTVKEPRPVTDLEGEEKLILRGKKLKDFSEVIPR